MFSIHVISDLFLHPNEPTPESETTIPDVDLVIVNGNISEIKRCMLYLDYLCKKYPTTQFVFNYGFLEQYIGYLIKDSTSHEEGLKLREILKPLPYKNFHFCNESKIITLRNGAQVDILTKFGFPKIYRFDGDWKDTYWYKNVVMETTTDLNHPKFNKPKDTSNVSHGHWFIWADMDWINQQQEKEELFVKRWEMNGSNVYKLLVTHINPVKDSRMKNIVWKPYQIHLKDMIWVGSDTNVGNTLYMGARVISNPGRGVEARSKVVIY